MTKQTHANPAADTTSSADASTQDLASNFLRQAIEHDLADGAYPQGLRTRFPPEPNGYLHVGHAKSICLNFGLAQRYGGRCHMRFDDTNPEKENDEYARSILEAVRWLGFDWGEHLYHASDYFDTMRQAAEHLILAGHAYVDQQTAEEIRQNRGTLTEPGVNSPYRERPAAESLALFQAMCAGDQPEGSMVLRAKLDMASPNVNMRDPALYRIKHLAHHRSGNRWFAYPMYTFAHPIEDAIEGISHSICTLEFEDQRPFYDWLLARLAEPAGDRPAMFQRPLPRQIEFARLNLTYVVTSKRKLQQLVADGHVKGWDDPRMPTILGLRRRGYTPASIALFCERIGVSRADSWIDYSILEQALRDDLDPIAPRRVAVLNPLRLVLENVPADWTVACKAPVNPHQPEQGGRHFPITASLWIEREDFMVTPSKGFFRLSPGQRVRLRYGFVIECTGYEQDAAGEVSCVRATVLLDSQSGTPGADNYKVKGNIHWVSAAHAQAVTVRLYDRLFSEPQPDAGGRDFMASLQPDSVLELSAWLEPGAALVAEQHVQFERHGYFVTDRVDHRADRPVFNRVVALKSR